MNQEITKAYDSEFCGNVPVHLINVIQTYGVLMVFDRTSGNVIQVSENAASVFGLPLDTIIGSKYDQLFEAAPNFDSVRDKMPHLLEINGTRFLAIFSAHPSYLLMEINLDSSEQALDGTFINVYQDLRNAMSAIENASDIVSTLQSATKELKKVSGFDKVMIYRFDENWSGHVLTEEMEEGMESYIGLTFPASDIPKQARDLYHKNPYRFIPDRNYQPVRMYPVINPATFQFIDLSDCNVRGVTTVHLEYLKNMGVCASMSTRILKNGKLWGLIACHHRTPLKMDLRMCAVFELLSNIMSARILALENQETHRYESRITDIYRSIVEKSYRTSDLVNALFHESGSILDLFDSEGAVMVYRGYTHQIGTIPETPDVEDITLWLAARESDDIYYTNSLPHEYDYAVDFRQVASGLLSIPIDMQAGEYILVFRRESERLISWGGDPEKRINFEENLKTYHPRHSFKVWQEKVTGMSEPWKETEIDMAKNVKEFVEAFLNGKEYSYSN